MKAEVNKQDLKAEFSSIYGSAPRIFRAPGRVNLIGEHTDYNDGFVMPCAIGFSTTVAIAPREDRLLRFRSRRFEGEFSLVLGEPVAAELSGWAKYVIGVATILERDGNSLRGADILIDSDLPIGAGLSSSAALETAIGYALLSVSGLEIDKWKLARTGQKAEHEFAGVRSGIMDQFASAFGVKDHALFLDCRSLEWSPVPLSGANFMIFNTRTKHDLADGEYNLRRADCETAAAMIGKDSLRDASLADLNETSMPERIFRRARHVVTENMRVIDAVKALRSGNLALFGRLMNGSHDSLRDDFEVSCAELDTMVEILRADENVLGARMTGGGFGGCVVALLRGKTGNSFRENIIGSFQTATGITPELYDANAENGVREIV